MSKLIEALLARQYLLLILIALLLLVSGINTYSLRGSTEPREAGVAAEMLQDGDYVVPRLNGEKFLEKPPLSYWLQAASLRVFGYEPFAVRAPSILAGVLCVCLMFFAVERLLNSRELAWLAALLLLTMASFWMNARIAGQDVLLTLGVAITLFGFYFAHSCSLQKSAAQKYWWLLYALGVFVATFTKGVIGAAIPGFVIVVFLCVDAQVFQRGWRIGDWLRPMLFAMVGVVPLALWLFALYQQQGFGDVSTLLWANSFERFSGDYTRGAHSEPFYYYLKKLPETFAPWNLLLFAALWQMRKQIVRERNLAFFCCWLLAPYLLLSLSAGKRPTYLLMIYPAAAVLIALFMQGVLAQPLRARAWRRCVAAALALLAILYIGYGGMMLRRDKDADSMQAVFASLHELEQQGHTVILFQPIERVAGGARFYLQHSVAKLDDAVQLQALLERDRTAAILIADGDIAQLHDYRVLKSFLDQKRKYLIIAGALVTP